MIRIYAKEGKNMGLTDILLIINTLLLLGAVGCFFFLRQRDGQKADFQEMQKMREELIRHISRTQSEAVTQVRAELQQEMKNNRTELSESLNIGMERLGKSLTTVQREQNQRQDERLVELIKTQSQIFTMQDKRLADMQSGMTALLSEKMNGISTSVTTKLSEIDKQFRELREQNRKEQEELRRILEERLLLMQTQNAQQLEKMQTQNTQQMEKMQSQNKEQLEAMRATVDEKLQKTLDERISQSFKMVNERLAEVYKGLGEMQTLAGSVGDLKKVISGVKTRGILGEIQLGAIMEEMLTPEQYEVNIPTKRGSANRVEFAIRLPGDEAPVYLPVDAKFPADAYTHLMDAYDMGDPEKIKEAGVVFEQRIKAFAKDIRDKYIDPPNTTSFGIMFLPFEGLYAEVVRRGMIEILQRQYQISVAGPTTFSALLNSLQMGFRTLAIQKRSGEVWEVLSAVKTEFGNFGKVLAKAQERIEQTSKELDTLVGVRTRKINSKLRAVSELPAADAQALIDVAVEEEV